MKFINFLKISGLLTATAAAALSASNGDYVAAVGIFAASLASANISLNSRE